MIKKQKYPILEFDTDRKAIIAPLRDRAYIQKKLVWRVVEACLAI